MKKVIVVSGSPRSGTSMMMRMLQEGGIKAFHNSHGKEDEHNPDGYFQTSFDLNGWVVAKADGKCIKVHTNKLKTLPKNYFGNIEYKVIFMKRNPVASAKSIHKMHSAEVTQSDEAIVADYAKDIKEVEGLKMNVLYINYEDTIANPIETCNTINDLIGGLNVKKMAKIPDSKKKHF